MSRGLTFELGRNARKSLVLPCTHCLSEHRKRISFRARTGADIRADANFLRISYVESDFGASNRNSLDRFLRGVESHTNKLCKFTRTTGLQNTVLCSVGNIRNVSQRTTAIRNVLHLLPTQSIRDKASLQVVLEAPGPNEEVEKVIF